MKNLKIYFLAQICLLFLSSSLYSQTQPIDARRVGQKLGQMILNQDKSFDFEDLTDREMWSIIIATDSIVEVVYRPSKFKGELLNVDLSRSNTEFTKARSNVERSVVQKSSLIQRNFQKFRDMIVYEDDEAPIFYLKVSELEVIQALRSHPDVESVGFSGLERISENRSARTSDFESGLFGVIGRPSEGGVTRSDNDHNGFGLGCNNEAASNPKTFNDEGGYKRPWHYDEMKIDKANYCTAGDNIKVALMDTGLSKDQKRLSTTGFKKTFSGRTLSKTNSIIGGVNDQCGHGTLMAGVIAGPQYDKAIRGVAYEADLVSIRSNIQVLQTTYAGVLGIALGLKKIYKGKDGTSGTKIVSMSNGHLLPNALVHYYIRKLNNKKGMLLFGAIGTSFNAEINELVQVFPALYPEVIGVTGVYKGFPGYKKSCYNCHYGFAVDFVVPMQYQAGDKNSRIMTHSLMMAGSDPASVGGSSIATATMAGVAALVWSTTANKNKTNSQIKEILKANSSSPNNRSLFYGWGVVDVAKAVGCSGPPQTDPCQGIECPPNQHCVNGKCIPKQTDLCKGVLCPPTYHCVNGDCVPININTVDCDETKTCPQGEHCVNGKCEPF